MKQRMQVWVGSVIIAGIVAFSGGMGQAAATHPVEKDLNQKRKDLKDIRKELSLTKEREKKIKGAETSILENLHGIETELQKKEKELREMEIRLDRTKDKLQETQRQIAVLSGETERTRSVLFSRLAALYKMERIRPETFFLISQSYIDLLKIDKYLRVVIHFDRALIKTYCDQVTMKERHQEELTRDRFQWQRSISEVEEKKDEIKKVREAKRTLLKAIQSQQVVYRKVIEELEERAKGLQSLIDKLEREKSLFAYGKSKPEAAKGKLPPPVRGKVISLFREKGQNGVEIKAPMGSEIRAILAGKVLYADWFKSFGNVIIIDHGDHTVTVSAYCSKLLKKEGDIVSQGEAVALVGEAGSLKGPCVYFEVRHQGKPQDPLLWIAATDKFASLPEDQEKERRGVR